jgi:ABC-type sugar transport system substrate-binding protein
MKHPYHYRVSEAAKAEAEKLGIQLLLLDARVDNATQISNIETFITKKVDIINVMPVTEGGVIPGFLSAKAAGIPIMTSNDALEAKYYPDPAITYVGSSDVLAGRIAGLYLAAVLNGKGNIVYIHGYQGISSERSRNVGFMEVLSYFPGIRIVHEAYGKWDRESGVQSMEAALTKSPRKGSIDAVFAHNDEMALGALRAIERANRREIKIIGIDGMPDALAGVKEGKMAATVFQDAETQAATTVQTALKILKGEKVATFVEVPWKLITQANVDPFIAKMKDLGLMK